MEFRECSLLWCRATGSSKNWNRSSSAKGNRRRQVWIFGWRVKSSVHIICLLPHYLHYGTHKLHRADTTDPDCISPTIVLPIGFFLIVYVLYFASKSHFCCIEGQHDFGTSGIIFFQWLRIRRFLCRSIPNADQTDPVRIESGCHIWASKFKCIACQGCLSKCGDSMRRRRIWWDTVQSLQNYWLGPPEFAKCLTLFEDTSCRLFILNSFRTGHHYR